MVTVVVALSIVLIGCGQGDPDAMRERLYLPPPDFVPDAGIGRQAFQARCTQCHGKSAQGTDEGPPLVDPVYRPGHHADLAFRFAVRDGVKQHHWHFGDMAPQPKVTSEQAGHMISYIRKLQRKEGIR